VCYSTSRGGKVNFLEAIKAMREGRKVRRDDWYSPTYCIAYTWGFLNQDGREQDFDIDDYEATDWEVVEVVDEI